MRNKHGLEIEPSVAFKNLRDKVGTSDRHGRFDSSIFSVLESVGVSRRNLLLAWDFTTNTKSDTTGRLVAARDDARKRVGEDGPEYVIDSVTYNMSALIAKQIKGRFKMPTYLNTHKPIPSARLVLDHSNLPVFQSYQWYEFEVLVPTAFAESANSVGELLCGFCAFVYGFFSN
mgnify:CR=1 FL=1